MTSQRADLTFKYNRQQGRHGWLRLTPAYSVKLVKDILERDGKPTYVLDPFAGTGTTGLVCAEMGIPCDLVELNPFSSWFARAKTYPYTQAELEAARRLAHDTASQARYEVRQDKLWTPPINHIERWWSPQRLQTLASLFALLKDRREQLGETPELNLVLIAFCRVAIEWSNAAFNHQSMSFKGYQPTLFDQDEHGSIIDDFLDCVGGIVTSAKQPLLMPVTVRCGDSRGIHTLAPHLYERVITSPPYPNRISYIRELRPYMYWLGFLQKANEAGDLDWQAIGGTWGVATSRLTQWTPDSTLINYDGFDEMVDRIRRKSLLLANYVHKYFCDMVLHLSALPQVLLPGAKIYYIVGNSKFYETLVPVDQIYIGMLQQCGFVNARREILRKRNSKKELFEYLISAEWA